MDEEVRNGYIRYKLDMIDLRESHKKSYEAGNLKGLKKGKEEEKISIAKNLLSLGIQKTKISQATGLSIAEIENIIFLTKKRTFK